MDYCESQAFILMYKKHFSSKLQGATVLKTFTVLMRTDFKKCARYTLQAEELNNKQKCDRVLFLGPELVISFGLLSFFLLPDANFRKSGGEVLWQPGTLEMGKRQRKEPPNQVSALPARIVSFSNCRPLLPHSLDVSPPPITP